MVMRLCDWMVLMFNFFIFILFVNICCVVCVFCLTMQMSVSFFVLQRIFFLVV